MTNDKDISVVDPTKASPNEELGGSLQVSGGQH